MRLTGFILAAMALAGACLLAALERESRRLERLNHELRASLTSEHNALTMLRIEWSRLNAPKRLAILNQRYLGLRAPPLTPSGRR